MSATVIDKSLKSLVKQNEGSASVLLQKAFAEDETVAKYQKRFERLKEIREPMETKWKQVVELLDPAASRWLDDSGDDDDAIIDDSQILDTTPRKMAQTAADGLHGGLSNPATQWFSFYVGEYESFDTEVSKESKLWLELAQECVRDILSNTNFYVALHSLYREALEFGCALMMMYSDADKYIRCYNYTIGSYWASQNNNREIDTIYIKSRQSAADIINTYGEDRCPDIVIDAIDSKDPDRKFTIMQCIQPWNFFGEVGENSRYAYEDVRFIEGSKEDDPILFRGGYNTKPFIFSRWSESWDYVYPRTCPGIDALPDIRQLYSATEAYNLAVAWLSTPAWLIDVALIQDFKDIKPGDIIKMTASPTSRAPVQSIVPPVFDVATNIQYRQALLDKISSIFYNREIMMITSRAEQNHTMTATEVALLQQEKNAVLGPITNRTAGDILMPCLDRAFEIITKEWSILDEPPEELYNREIKPYFMSDLAVTQRQVWIQRANDVLMWAQQIAGVDPTVLDSFDMDQWAREFERTDVIPAQILRSRQEVEDIRQQRAQQMQQQQQMDALDSTSKVAQRLGKTPTTGDNAAAEMLAQSGGIGALTEGAGGGEE